MNLSLEYREDYKDESSKSRSNMPPCMEVQDLELVAKQDLRNPEEEPSSDVEAYRKNDEDLLMFESRRFSEDDTASIYES